MGPSPSADDAIIVTSDCINDINNNKKIIFGQANTKKVPASISKGKYKSN